MLYNFQRKKLYRHLLVGGALCAAGFGLFSCSDKYDLDSDQPSGLNSIYSYIQQQGNYTNYLRLIDDLGEKEILSKTGSRTIFIADDAAFGRFFDSNPWGVKSYGELSYAQKKLLLNTSMIGNPYTTSMLSTASGSIAPVKGEVCRRASSLSILDSVMVVSSDDPQGILPQNASFDNLRANHESFVLFTDASSAPPILHFSQKFLTGNKLQSTDVDFLYNQPAGTRQADDVYVNNAKVTEANVFCKNGFVHKVDEVILPLDNMAEVIRKNPQMSIFSSILERFAAVDYDEDLTKSYNNDRGTDYDSVFIKRYYARRSAGSTSSKTQSFSEDKSGGRFDAQLKYDPGWNAYTSGSEAKGDNELMEDMAVMMVPTNEALLEWWNNGSGSVIREFYSTIEDTPNSTLDDLLNVNQLAALTAALPSTFDQIKDDSQERMVVTPGDIDKVYLACNGVVYLTNKVFAPRSYSSVLFPTVVDTLHFKIIANAIKHLDYSAYLNSMSTEYIFVIPTNNGLLSYIDPVSYCKGEELQIMEFVASATKKSEDKDYVVANIYKGVSNGDGTWEKGDKVNRSPITYTMDNSESSKTNKNGLFKNRFEDMLDNHVIIEPYQAGKKYYKTKGNTFVRIDGIEPGSNVYGSWQAANEQPLKVQTKYPMENGNAIVIDGALMGTNNSVAMTLAEHDEFSEFLAILKACGALNVQNSKDTPNWYAGDNVHGNLLNIKEAGHVGAETLSKGKKATYLLNNFHYTIYAPTNEAMAKAYAMGLPTLDDLEAAETFDTEFAETTKSMSDAEKKAYAAAQGTCAGDSAERVQEAMLDFVKYHIQDNSIFIDAGFESGSYESGKTELIRSTASATVKEEDLANYDIVEKKRLSNGDYDIVYNQKDDAGNQYYSPGRPYKLSVQVSPSSLSVNGISVDMARGLYNLMAREYWYTSDTKEVKNPYECKLDNSSAVVIHGINEPLVYDAPAQFKYTYKKLAVSTE